MSYRVAGLLGEVTLRTVKDRAYAEISAAVGRTLCKIAIHLLDNQVNSQARASEKDGGFSERLYKVRSAVKRQQTKGGA
ncbi:MAG: hypothetical protein IT227_08820 [Flavobacteriales bacterium]|nr:hypothetical protein [Flavobacteriales bacterium]